MPGLDCRRLQDRIVRAERRMLPADGWCRPCLAAEVRGHSCAVVVAVAPISATPGWQRGLAVLAVHRGGSERPVRGPGVAGWASPTHRAIAAAAVNCEYCQTSLPAGSRRDRRYCNNNCTAMASYFRRKAGAAPPVRWQHPAFSSDNPVLQSAAVQARHLGETHSWRRSNIRLVMEGLTGLRQFRPAGQPVTLSEVRNRTPRHASTPRVAEVLTGLGLLEDDTTPPIRSWIEHRTSDLPAGFAVVVRSWLLVLLDGDKRTAPRSHSTLYVYFGTLKPFLAQWAVSYTHLRAHETVLDL